MIVQCRKLCLHQSQGLLGQKREPSSQTTKQMKNKDKVIPVHSTKWLHTYSVPHRYWCFGDCDGWVRQRWLESGLSLPNRPMNYLFY